MPGGSTTTTSQQQQGTTSPWAGALGPIERVLGIASGLPAGVTGKQKNALGLLQQEAGGVPNFAPQATAGVTGLLGGGGANQYAPMLQDAYNSFRANVLPTASPNNIDPFSNPYLAPALGALKNNITGGVDDVFAASGNFGGPQNAKALGTGLSQGMAPLLMGQYNTGLQNFFGANNALYNAGSGTAGALTGLNQTGNQNILSGIGAAPAASNLGLAPGQAALGVANTAYSQPYQNLGMLANLIYPAAGFGSQSTSSMQGTQTQQQPLGTTIAGLGLGGAGLLGGMFGGQGMFSPNGAFGPNGYFGRR